MKARNPRATADAIGLERTFLIAGVGPGIFAIAATLIWKLHHDELENPIS